MSQRDLFPEAVRVAKGKTIDALKYSRAVREDVLALFDGEIPQSILYAVREKRGDDDLASGSYEACSGNDTGISAFDVCNQSTRHGALSMFPQNIGRTLLRLYSKDRDIVIDPFAGHNSRLALCVTEGRHYHGYDVSRRFMAFNRKLAESEELRKYGRHIELFEADARTMAETPDHYGNFTITSPPYWDIEHYGDEPEQLGNATTYAAFIASLLQVVRSNYRCLKSGAFAVYCVNDFRRKGIFYTYHIHVMQLLCAAGFEPFDIAIVDGGPAIRAAFASQLVETKILPKRHEYALVVRKP